MTSPGVSSFFPRDISIWHEIILQNLFLYRPCFDCEAGSKLFVSDSCDFEDDNLCRWKNVGMASYVKWETRMQTNFMLYGKAHLYKVDRATFQYYHSQLNLQLMVMVVG